MGRWDRLCNDVTREAEGKRPGTKWPYGQPTMCRYLRHRTCKNCDVFESRKALRRAGEFRKPVLPVSRSPRRACLQPMPHITHLQRCTLSYGWAVATLSGQSQGDGHMEGCLSGYS